MGGMPAVRPVSQAEIALSRRLERATRPPDPPPADLAPASVRFTPQELGAVPARPVTLPVPPQPTLAERVQLDRPIGNSTALISAVLVGTMPPPWVTASAYLDAVRNRFTTGG